MAGKYVADLEVGQIFDHPNGRTIPGTDSVPRSGIARPKHTGRNQKGETILANPDGYIIPKVETPDDVRAISHRMDKIAIGLGVVVSRVRLWAVIETALGVMNLREIAQASPRLTALMFGAEDYAASVGATRTERGEEVLFARSAVVAAAAAYELDAIDIVRFDLADPAGLEAECRFGRQLGYAGKVAIHPG